MIEETWHTLSYTGGGSAGSGAVSATLEIDAASPWFSGHFPGDPILPGIALLAMVSELIRRHAADTGKRAVVSGIRRVRFRTPVRPGARLAITVSLPQGGGHEACTFKIAVNGEAACSGIMDIKLSE